MIAMTAEAPTHAKAQARSLLHAMSRYWDVLRGLLGPEPWTSKIAHHRCPRCQEAVQVAFAVVHDIENGDEIAVSETCPFVCATTLVKLHAYARAEPPSFFTDDISTRRFGDLMVEIESRLQLLVSLESILADDHTDAPAPVRVTPAVVIIPTIIILIGVVVGFAVSRIVTDPDTAKASHIATAQTQYVIRHGARALAALRGVDTKDFDGGSILVTSGLASRFSLFVNERDQKGTVSNGHFTFDLDQNYEFELEASKPRTVLKNYSTHFEVEYAARSRTHALSEIRIRLMEGKLSVENPACVLSLTGQQTVALRPTMMNNTCAIWDTGELAISCKSEIDCEVTATAKTAEQRTSEARLLLATDLFKNGLMDQARAELENLEIPQDSIVFAKEYDVLQQELDRGPTLTKKKPPKPKPKPVAACGVEDTKPIRLSGGDTDKGWLVIPDRPGCKLKNKPELAEGCKLLESTAHEGSTEQMQMKVYRETEGGYCYARVTYEPADGDRK
jgi:hypothetical protein